MVWEGVHFLEFCYSVILGVGCLLVPFLAFSFIQLFPSQSSCLLLAPLQVAHPLVQKQLVDYIHNGFLVPVMGPALHKVRVMASKTE